MTTKTSKNRVLFHCNFKVSLKREHPFNLMITITAFIETDLSLDLEVWKAIGEVLSILEGLTVCVWLWCWLCCFLRAVLFFCSFSLDLYASVILFLSLSKWLSSFLYFFCSGEVFNLLLGELFFIFLFFLLMISIFLFVFFY